MMRSTVFGAEFVCSVPKTRCPVSAAVIPSPIVSLSRISPTRITSGSSRSAARSAAENDFVCVKISRWFTRHILFGYVNSIGSPIVRMWSFRVSLMRSMMAVRVVNFPGPVTRIPGVRGPGTGRVPSLPTGRQQPETPPRAHSCRASETGRLREGRASAPPFARDSLARDDPNLPAKGNAVSLHDEGIGSDGSILEREHQPSPLLHEGRGSVLRRIPKERELGRAESFLEEPHLVNPMVEHHELDDVPRMDLEEAGNRARAECGSSDVHTVNRGLVWNSQLSAERRVGWGSTRGLASDRDEGRGEADDQVPTGVPHATQYFHPRSSSSPHFSHWRSQTSVPHSGQKRRDFRSGSLVSHAGHSSGTSSAMGRESPGPPRTRWPRSEGGEETEPDSPPRSITAVPSRPSPSVSSFETFSGLTRTSTAAKSR